MSELDSFFKPGGVAVVGASDKKGKVGNVIVNKLLENKKKGKLESNVYPVNPKIDEVEDMKCYSSISNIDEEVDLAVISIPAPHVPDTIEECGKNGVKSAIIITGGFGELGEEGKRLEEKTAELGKEYGVRIIGPNCVGIFDSENGVDTVFLPDDRMARPGPGNTSFISQSGAFVATMLDWAAKENFGIAKTISYGNKIDVNDADVLQYLKSDDQTDVITMYIEGMDDGREFIESAKEVSKEKPIVAVKSGKSEAGASAASSHTGSLAGSDQVYDAAFKQTGVIRADDFFHMFDIAKALEKQGAADGDNVSIVTDGGGAGVMATDACEEQGLNLAELSEETKSKIREEFPPHAIVGNPTDVVGDTDKERYEIAIENMINDDNVDGLVVIILFQVPLLENEVVDRVAEYANNTDKPIVACAMGGEHTKPHANKLERLGVPTYPSPERAVRAMKGLVDYGEYKKK